MLHPSKIDLMASDRHLNIPQQTWDTSYSLLTWGNIYLYADSETTVALQNLQFYSTLEHTAMIIINQCYRRKKHRLPGDFTGHLDSHFRLSFQTSGCYSLDHLICFLLVQLTSLCCLDIFPHLIALWCVFLRHSNSSFPDHMPFTYLFTHLVFLISLFPFSLLSQHLQLENCHGHPIPIYLSCSSLNILDSWPHICFMLGFPAILVEYTSEAHWCPVNPRHLMRLNLKPSPHPVSYSSG